MRIALFAGEASGDLLGAGLIRSLRSRFPSADFEGIAGPLMQAEGCHSIYPMERLSVMGLAEVAGRMPEVLRMRATLARRYIETPPDVFVGIDAPDFNLHLEMRLKRAGIKIVHYVSPSVWAWRQYRLRKIKAGVDRMLVLFPFEAQFYAQHGVDVRFVGHPLADELQSCPDHSQARSALRLPCAGQVVALLPGSRNTEVEALSARLIGSAHWLAARRSPLSFVVPLISDSTHERFARALHESPGPAVFKLIRGDARTAMAAADVVLLASGTATLEALLIGRPMVITYRTHPLTWAIGRRMLNVDCVGLPNLLAGRPLVAELLQDAGSPRRLGAEVLALLDCAQARSSQVGEFAAIAATLRNNASECAADAIAEVIAFK
ncbi:MAG: lipid-A-disaccharide synthase [Gammaproteobacteria bacterium]